MRKIKEIEITKNFENPKIPIEFLEQLMKNIYSTIGITNLNDFRNYLSEKNINYNNVLKKIETEALWNELIVLKFSNKIKVNKARLRVQAEEIINKETKTYLMSEIFLSYQRTKIRWKIYRNFDAINKIGLIMLLNIVSETASISGKLID